MEGQLLNTVRIGNSGHPIIVMHGWGHSSNSMRALGELLAQTAQVHLIDLPGFGKSAPPTSDWDTVEYAQRIYRYMKDEGIETADLLGHSFGGRVAIRLTRRHPEKVRGLVLISSGGLRRKLSGKKKLRAKMVGVLGKVLKRVDKLTGAKLFESWFIPRFGSVDYKNAGRLRNILVRAVNEDVSEDAANISNPTFILWGELDQETPLEMGERLHALIRNSKLLVLPGKDHYSFVGDGAHLCAKYILEFLRSLGVKEAPANGSVLGATPDNV